MNQKTASIVSYITIIGWLISFFSTKDQQRDSLVKFHLKQSLGLAIVSLFFNIATTIVAILVPAIATIASLSGLGILVLLVIGVLNASKEQETPLPFIGNLFVSKFNFI
jgi:uncharacterized membrane protein